MGGFLPAASQFEVLDRQILPPEENIKENQPHAQPPQQSTQMAEAKAAMTEWDKGPGKGDGFGDDDIPF